MPSPPLDMPYHLKALIGLSFGVMVLSGLPVSAEGGHPHSVNENAGDCQNCHVNPPKPGKHGFLETKNKTFKLADFKNDGVVMCTSCHNPDDGHKIGLKLDFDVPADLPLDKNNTLSCLTCHYTHGRLDSDRPQASHSFMDHLLDSERLHKSFLLRRNNVDGELCLICHNPNHGKK